MPNIFFELERLKTSLINKGLDDDTVSNIVQKAAEEIKTAMHEQGENAMQQAIESGVNKNSPDFINELMMDETNMELITSSGNFDFSEPPFPMLSKLIQGGKPMKDGSGVYKVIPVGAPSLGNRQKVSTNIYDAQKKINAERIEAAREQYQGITPSGSKAQFRTATSKQNANSQWVIPAKEKNFEEDMKSINAGLRQSMESIIMNIIRSYEESF